MTPTGPAGFRRDYLLGISKHLFEPYGGDHNLESSFVLKGSDAEKYTASTAAFGGMVSITASVIWGVRSKEGCRWSMLMATTMARRAVTPKVWASGNCKQGRLAAPPGYFRGLPITTSQVTWTHIKGMYRISGIEMIAVVLVVH